MPLELKIWRDGHFDIMPVYASILTVNSCLNFKIYLPLDEYGIEKYIGGRKKLIEFDYLITNIPDVKFCLLNIRNELVEKYYDLNDMFKIRLKYFDESVNLIEYGKRLYDKNYMS